MAKKKFIVLPRNKKISDTGVELNGKKMEFHKGSALWMKDEGEVKELQAKYPRDIAVTVDQQYTWHSNNEQGDGTRMDNIHNYTFQGVDMSGIRVTKDNGYVWVNIGGKQVRMKKRQALEEGLEIIPQKRDKRRKSAEELYGV